MEQAGKKYELTSDVIEVGGRKLFRIKALRDFANVKAGDLGGYIEKEENLSHEGNCWIGGDAMLFGYASVSEGAQVYEYAVVRGNARVYGNAKVRGGAKVSGNTYVYGDAHLGDHAHVSGNAKVGGNAMVSGEARVRGNVCVVDHTHVGGDAKVCGNADYVTVRGFGSEYRTTTFYIQKEGSIGVQCGCFNGNLTQFREQVKKTHGDTKFAKEYLMIADLMELHFCMKAKENH